MSFIFQLWNQLVILDVVSHLSLVLVWRWDRFSKSDDKLLRSDRVLLVVGDEGVQGVEKDLLNQEVAHAPVSLLSVFDGDVINFALPEKREAVGSHKRLARPDEKGAVPQVGVFP